MAKKILHLAGCAAFIPSFIEFVKESFELSEHEFLLTEGMASHELKTYPNVYLSKTTNAAKLRYYSQAIIKMHKADKIFLHSLFDAKLNVILFSMPWLLKKSYWVIWGGDLYVYQLGQRNYKRKIREFFRRPVIKNMGHLVTYIQGDVDLARKWYGAKGEYHECLMYLSNTYKALKVSNIQSGTINIQLGNSADPSNNHIEILDKLLPFKDKNIRIYAPLSYGDKAHAKEIVSKGKELFGDKFIALTDFMSLEQYLKFLGSIDIAIFNHKRQQAMGNTITLLGLGKTVFIRSDTTQWQLFKDKNIEVYDSMKLESLNKKEHLGNIKKVKNYFSRETLIKQYSEIF